MGIHEFWMQVYISAIRASNGPHYAEEIADQALQSFKRLDVDRVGKPDNMKERIYKVVQEVLNRWYERGDRFNPEQLACEVLEALYPEVRPADAAPFRPHE
jgi:hypothetical protein